MGRYLERDAIQYGFAGFIRKADLAKFDVAMNDRELHRVFVEAFGGGRPADTPAVLLARVGRDSLGAIRRATWE